MIALVEMAEEPPFEECAECCTAEKRQRQREPRRADTAGHQIGDIGADHEQRAVREIDDAHHAEDQREAAGDQEQQEPVLHAIEELREEAGQTHARLLMNAI